MARLVGESGPVAGKTWTIDQGLTLGREGHNTIAMPENKKSSRDHAKVWREAPGRYAVADLGSTNGTLVNDDKVTRHVLVDGDELRVGDATFRFLLDEEDKPKKKEAPARATDAFGRPVGTLGAPGAAAGGGADAAVPTIQVKQRLLQYGKKSAKGGVAGYDLSQAAGWRKWALVLVALAVAAGLFFAVTRLVG